MAGPSVEKFSVTSMNFIQNLDESGADFSKMGISPIEQAAAPAAPAPAPTTPGLGV